MEIKTIKELMAYMDKTGTRRLIIKKEGFEIEIEQQGSHSNPEVLPTLNSLRSEMEHHRQQTSLAKESVPQDPAEPAGTYISSPMVGTFYRSPSPDAAPFVKEGQVVKKGDIVCIVEAMKVMNEVRAEVGGTVQKALIESGHPVEFGTKLFLIA